jgi:hypothetical protein
MATDLMEDLVDELEALSMTNPSLSRDLMHKGARHFETTRRAAANAPAAAGRFESR